MSVDIIDLGSGNIRSIHNALLNLNVSTNFVKKPHEIQANTVILAGVGAAGPYMKKLIAADFKNALRDHVAAGKTIIGICLGFQILSNATEENGGVEGLGIINGRCERLNHNDKLFSHNGWEKLDLDKANLLNVDFRNEENLSRKQKIKGRVFYNHEYGMVLNQPQPLHYDMSIPTLDKYTAFYAEKNVLGIQFHPEKSQFTGQALFAMVL